VLLPESALQRLTVEYGSAVLQAEVLTCLPMFHVGGMNIQTTPALYAGATVTIHWQFDANRVLQEIDQQRITLLLIVPPVARALMSHPAWDKVNLSKLRSVAIGSTIVPPDVMCPWIERGILVTEVYGLTESCPIAIVLPLQKSERKLGSVGKPVLYCQAHIIDVNGHDVDVGERSEIVLREGHSMSSDQVKALFIGRLASYQH
jgi:fatty-acyl-CoA synthase